MATRPLFLVKKLCELYWNFYGKLIYGQLDIGGLFMKFSCCIYLHKVLTVPLHTDTVPQ